ncbi:GNAT family N-acetyltransferase [Candidatus Dependentiae bacterium]|nr:GNAT family N-acetyltransferase [Candidatus Dependentiae bacterium]
MKAYLSFLIVCCSTALFSTIRIDFDDTICETLRLLPDHISWLQEAVEQSLHMSHECQVVIRPLHRDELEQVSAAIIQNFIDRPEYQQFDEQALALYKRANSYEHLTHTLAKPTTYAFVAATTEHNDFYGIIIVRQKQCVGHPLEMQIRLLHTFLSKPEGVKGVGKTLLNIAVAIAKAHGQSSLTAITPGLMATAALPARPFFEHCGFVGDLIEKIYQLPTGPVRLQQFKCHFSIPDHFAGFC